MAASKYTFTVEQGTTTDFEVQWNDSNNLPVDLTGYEAKMQIKSDYKDNNGTLYLTLSSSIGDTYTKNSGSSFLSLSGSNLTTPLTSGSIGIYIGHEASNTYLTGSSYFYDIELTSGETRSRLLEGLVIIKKQVTS
tara:strand:- start:1139 stop:1546 length:408 start_codon:yes stop_codon:yes gene_type:complete